MTFDPVLDFRAEDLPRLDASVGDLMDFANAFPGYDIWGTQQRLIEVRDGVLGSVIGFHPCCSILKLRTAMFALVREARFVDEMDGPFDMPREATNEAEMRTVLPLLRAAVVEGPREDTRVAEAVRLLAQAVPQDGPFHERDLRDRLCETLRELYEPASGAQVYEGVEQSLGQLSGWAALDPPGKFDLGLGAPRNGHIDKYRLLAEVKWSDHNTVSHSIWDAAKLISALVVRADHVYLIGGWPVSVWAKAPASALYSDGLVDFRAMIELPGEWPSLLSHSQGTPLRLPSRLRVRQLARITVPRRDPASGTLHEWEIRTATLEPATGDWLYLPDGNIGSASLEHEHENGLDIEADEFDP